MKLKTAAPKPRKPKSGAPRGMKRSRLRPKNVKRSKKRFAENFGGEYADFIRSLPCAICEVRGFSEAAHVRSRGAGGKASDLVPLCGPHAKSGASYLYAYVGCHQKFDEFRWTLPPDTAERLQVLAAELYAEYHSNRDTK
jgi:hypothetical protein